MIDKTDEELMLAYQYGDESAFKILFDRHSARVYGYLLGRLKDRRHADDAFQNTYLKLHRSKHLYRANLPFLPWLFMISKSVLLNYVKSQKRSLEVLVDKLPDVAGEHGAPLEIPRLDQLNEQQRAVIEMRFQNDMSFEEIAKRIQTTPVNVRQLISRAIRKLRGEK